MSGLHAVMNPFTLVLEVVSCPSPVDGQEPLPALGEVIEVSAYDMPCIVGRDRERASVILVDKKVSRAHAQFVSDGRGGVLVVDSSSNGTLVDGRHIRGAQAELTDGCRLRIGDFGFEVHIRRGEPSHLKGQPAIPVEFASLGQSVSVPGQAAPPPWEEPVAAGSGVSPERMPWEDDQPPQPQPLAPDDDWAMRSSSGREFEEPAPVNGSGAGVHPPVAGDGHAIEHPGGADIGGTSAKRQKSPARSPRVQTSRLSLPPDDGDSIPHGMTLKLDPDLPDVPIDLDESFFEEPAAEPAPPRQPRGRARVPDELPPPDPLPQRSDPFRPGRTTAPATPAPEPVASPAPGAEVAQAQRALQAFMHGAGISDVPSLAEPEALERLHKAGRIFAETLDVVVELLKERNEFRQEVRSAVTVFTADENNPLKFSMDGLDAAGRLLSDAHPGFMDALQALLDAKLTLKVHQAAIGVATSAGKRAMTGFFEPSSLLTRMRREAGVGKGWLARKSAWSLFEDLYERESTGAIPECFDEAYGKEYHDAAEALITKARQDLQDALETREVKREEIAAALRRRGVRT